jgi:NAD(P)-dependent dehydrogenase (short-subunit alcohol dehydrogenase family)
MDGAAPLAGAPLAGKVILVTGAARGIGLGIARVLAGDGARVVLADRDAGPLADAAGALTAAGLDVLGVPADVTDDADVARAVEAATARYGRIDGLVNNAGVVKVAPFAAHTPADWERLTSVNLIGAFRVTRAVLPALHEHGSGSIVNVSSIAALGYTTSHAAYAATKAGMLAMTRELAAELAPARIRVNAVLPGFIRTELSGSVSAANGTLGAATRREPPADRWGQPEDVGYLTSFLMTERSSYITGAAITIAGGSELALGPVDAVGPPG